MQGYLQRTIEHQIRKDLRQFPAVAILGPRQCGKSTTAKEIGNNISNFLYLDLERPSDQRKLRDPELFFSANPDALICLDEIQRVPILFPVLRSIIDHRQRPGQFLILGSASRDLIQQSSESLAGRIAYTELTPFSYREVAHAPRMDLNTYWLRGGFPASVLATDTAASARWRENFIRTYLERDIPQMGFRVLADEIRKLWTMCAHYNGQTLNTMALGNALDISHVAVRTRLEILQQTFMLRLLQPLSSNRKKRLVKSPKMYIRDSGVLHELLELGDMNDLLAHPQVGASWEAVVIENVIAALPQWRPSFYRTATGVELDLVLERGKHRLAFECKASLDPLLSRGFYTAVQDIKPEHTWVVVPEGSASPVSNSVTIVSLQECITLLTKKYA